MIIIGYWTNTVFWDWVIWSEFDHRACKVINPTNERGPKTPYEFNNRIKWPPAAILSKQKQNCVSILNGQKCDRKLMADIQNGRQRPFCQKKIVLYGSELARNAIGSKFRTFKMADQSEISRNAIQNDLQTSIMAARKKILHQSEMARIEIKSEFRKSKMADRSEMARNAIESEFRTCIQNGRRQPFCQKFPKKKVAYRSEMARNAIESEIRTSKMADVSHFVKNFKKITCVSMWNG